ncbi:UDP-2-acetamido-3-amino-2,3-dideoxy-D-glucuronate N-acetyltransferase [compost metagenome]
MAHDVPAYALVVGNPAKQMGWMSAYGQRLVFDEQGMAVCTESGERYSLINNEVTRVEQ